MPGDEVLKLYTNQFSFERVVEFGRVGQLVVDGGVRAPAVHRVVTRRGRHGLVLDHIYGNTLWESIRAAPAEAASYGKRLAELHLSIHALVPPGLSSKLDQLTGRLTDDASPSSMLDDALAIVDRGRSDRQVLVHGDLHPANVMVEDETGELISIDWDGAMLGPAAFDVARASYLLAEWALAPGTAPIETSVRSQLAEAYVAHYCALGNIERGAIEEWSLPVVLTRRNEGIAQEVSMLETEVQRLLS